MGGCWCVAVIASSGSPTHPERKWLSTTRSEDKGERKEECKHKKSELLNLLLHRVLYGPFFLSKREKGSITWSLKNLAGSAGTTVASVAV